ncbi:very-long-chain (3R)-3-hydroxyacyl-CoA dehydratase-like [Limulus polyphemus]|uniref:Very-long-chain (3R)-3-hydroxyacyl-CoA dehydratase n=1 Tax=Limulus polyphemus TaxID=6850 RepID=A0ABM1S9C8_LIMPO|nr:very-long-chain (3R)-3-hydroxyacyl-CoA dehydratase-like [Limulus polyphemus]
MNLPSPIVYWAQTESGISLRVDLHNVKNPVIDLKEKRLIFTASGIGAKGEHKYQFQLEFSRPVIPETGQYRVNDREVEILVQKVTVDLWSQLTVDEKKPPWLKVDFDRLFAQEEENNMEDENLIMKEKLRDIIGTRKRSYQNVKDFWKVYLLFYNLIQFVGFLYILIVMLIRYAKEGPFSVDGTYEAVGRVMKICQLLQMLEIIHLLIGMTRGNYFMCLFQLCGRFLIIFALLDAHPRSQTKSAIFYLFIGFTIMEVIRYPYYMLKMYGVNIHFLTWLRYTLWIPLYPLVFICEAIIMFRNIPYFEQTGKFSMKLPNQWNFSFSFPGALRLYLLLGFFPTLYFMMLHMYRKRKKYLGASRLWKIE